MQSAFHEKARFGTLREATADFVQGFARVAR
jgi:hypothetical protein